MTPEQAKELREPFPPEQVGKLPKGSTELDYVGHGAVTSRLLEVDPEWQWEPLSVDDYGFPRLDSAGNLWIKLTVCGVTRLGVGDGPSMKVLIGDALRNAAMRFGVALDLWVRGHAEDDEKVAANDPPQSRHSAPKADELIDRVSALPQDAQDKLIRWMNMPVADWQTASPQRLTALAERVAKAEQVVAEQTAPATADEQDPAESSAANLPEQATTAAQPGPAAGPVVKPATASPSAAARAALAGEKPKDKPALGAVKNQPVADEEVVDHFPGAVTVEAS